MLPASSAVSAFLLLLVLVLLASAAAASGAAAAAAAATALRTAGRSCSVFFFSSNSCESYMVVDVIVQNPQRSSGDKYEKKHVRRDSKMCCLLYTSPSPRD